MVSLLEKILIYALGGIIGTLVGFILVKYMPFSQSLQNISDGVIILSIIIGTLLSIIIQKHNEVKTFEKNNRLRNETVALITHEMRTGLTSTGWAIQTVLKKYSDYIENDDKVMLEEVVKSIHTTINHSVNLLDVSMIDINKLSISLERISLNDIETLFKESFEKFSYGAKVKGVNFISNIKLDKEREMEVDKVRLRIILDNLLENAMQYTTNEKKEIDVKIYNDKNNLLIQVSDTGIGIPESEQANIFKEFYRAKNARAVLSSGSGIGLYTTSQYVKAHNGKITFHSEEGIGTTFNISIPLKTTADVNEFLEKI